MTVRELRVIIKDLPSDMEIILQKDNERFSPLSEATCNDIYIPDTTYSGKVYDTRWDAEEADMNKEEWNKIKQLAKSLVLWPTH